MRIFAGLLLGCLLAGGCPSEKKDTNGASPDENPELVLEYNGLKPLEVSLDSFPDVVRSPQFRTTFTQIDEVAFKDSLKQSRSRSWPQAEHAPEAIAWRKDNCWMLSLSSGDTLELCDEGEDGDESYREYFFMGYDSTHQLYLIGESLYEGGNVDVVERRDGEFWNMYEAPVANPSGSMIASASDYTDSGYIPSGLFILSLSGDSLTHACSMLGLGDSWGAEQFTWLSDSRFVITVWPGGHEGPSRHYHGRIQER